MLLPLRQVWLSSQMCYSCLCRSLAYKSVYNAENLYPASKSTMTYSSKTIVRSTDDSDDKFSGEIPLNKLTLKYSKSSGKGGQHVNKTLTKVEIRFHVLSAEWIPEDTRSLLLKKFRKRITKNGELIVSCDDSRYQMKNVKGCLDEIRNLITIAEAPPDTSKEERIAELYNMDSIQAAHKKRLMKKRKDGYTKAMRSGQYDL